MQYEFIANGLGSFKVHADTDVEAQEAADKHFAKLGEEALKLANYADGRWTLRNEGENENCEVCYVLFERELPLYVASFTSTAYPEDSRMLGIFSTRQNAEEKINDAVESDKRMYPNHPRRYQQKATYYDIDTYFIDE